MFTVMLHALKYNISGIVYMLSSNATGEGAAIFIALVTLHILKLVSLIVFENPKHSISKPSAYNVSLHFSSMACGAFQSQVQ